MDPSSRALAMVKSVLRALRAGDRSQQEQVMFGEGPIEEVLKWLRHAHSLLTIDRTSICENIRMLEFVLRTVQFFAVHNLSDQELLNVTPVHSGLLLPRRECKRSVCANLEVYVGSGAFVNPQDILDDVLTGVDRIQFYNHVFASDEDLRSLWEELLLANQDVMAALRGQLPTPLPPSESSGYS